VGKRVKDFPFLKVNEGEKIVERRNIMKLVKRFINDESGMETLEWAMVGALVVLGFVAIWVAFEPSLSGIFTQLAAELDSAGAPVP
jgi:Flp pilus assembly pilin Flp